MKILTQKLFAEIIEVARLAPSVHNTQPWTVKYDEMAITVDLDGRHKLTDGDPTGRQTYISLGIFAEAIIQSAENKGLKCIEVDLTEFSFKIHFEKLENSKILSNLIDMIHTRCTDRSIYKKTSISKSTKTEIKQCTINKSINIEIIDSTESISKVAKLTSKGISLAMSNPQFRKELSEYLVLPWSKSKRGISVRSLYIPYILEILQPIMVKIGASKNAEMKLEYKRWLSASAVVVITGAGDMPKYWFAAGRTYLRASLIIESKKLAQATSAAIVEASDFHEDIERLINTKDRILCIMRIGQSTKKKHFSPRIPANELIT